MTEPREEWTGRWAADRLGADLVSGAGVGGLRVEDLVGMALRRNPRRAHLLVSRVLGKHVPADPRLVLGAGRLLGALVADRLTGADGGIGEDGGKLLAAAVTGADPAAAARLLARCDQHRAGTGPHDVLVLGYAETATGLGAAVADALLADLLTSTRRSVPGAVPIGGFEESHSHATSHQLLPDDPRLLTAPRPVVLVDDELSTGNTVMDTVRSVQALAPRDRYVVATLLDLRSTEDRARLDAFARDLGVRIDVVALVTGAVRLPADVLARGQELVTRHGAAPAPRAESRGRAETRGRVERAAVRWPEGVRESGRHGATAADRAALDAAVGPVARGLLPALPAGNGARVLVLGTEELMYLPTRIAAELAELLADRGADVVVSSTTRSPVLAVDAPGYAIRTALAFDSSDSPVDGPGPRFAYNVAAPADGAPFDAAVLVVDDGGADGGALPELLARVVAGPVVVLPVPAVGPQPVLPEPLRGPGFGSYAPEEVGWLLTDLSDVPLEAPVEEREEAVQSGAAHYAASLPVEYQPSREYQELFAQALESGADALAHAVGLVTELALAERERPPVLVSLARAGTPIGILMRRWAAAVHGLDLPHLAVSIVRGRGIDQVALAWLAAHHDPATVLFVDGWTGKGAITRELSAALAEANAALGLPAGAGFADDLAVLADPGRCVSLYGTRDDVLIPSACLNSTVSGLVSRTVLNDRLIGPGQFHGGKYYAHLAADDVSATFLDAVSDRFAAVRERVAADLPALRAADRTPDWAGWRTVERLAQESGVGAVNLVKPGVGETTRVLLRRVPWRVLVRRDAVPALGHVLLLADQRGVEVEVVDDLTYSCVGIIRPGYTRGGAA